MRGTRLAGVVRAEVCGRWAQPWPRTTWGQEAKALRVASSLARGLSARSSHCGRHTMTLCALRVDAQHGRCRRGAPCPEPPEDHRSLEPSCCVTAPHDQSLPRAVGPETQDKTCLPQMSLSVTCIPQALRGPSHERLDLAPYICRAQVIFTLPRLPRQPNLCA